MDFKNDQFEELLPGYLSGDLSESELAWMDQWRAASPENESHFLNSLKAWESTMLLQEMENFNSFEALGKVHSRLPSKADHNWFNYLKMGAAILLLPLIVYSGYLTFSNISLRQKMADQVVVQTIKSRQGMVSQFQLADGTRVWLNSGSELQFPNHFTEKYREVTLKGEAFFEVTKDNSQPFRVSASGLKVEVLGTSFDVANYEGEKLTEVILVEGKVNLLAKQGNNLTLGGALQPGERGVYCEQTGKIRTEKVGVEKYIAWRDGNLIFRDDKMEDVVKRLSRWYNVEMVINDPEIKSYIYKATFRNENLLQVLNLLKISAPIDFRITERKVLGNGEFTKQIVYLMKKKT